MPPEAWTGTPARAGDRGDELGAHPARPRAVEVDQVDPPGAGGDPAAGERHGIVGALHDRVVVAAVQPHGFVAEHVDGGNHLDAGTRTTCEHVSVLI